MVASLKIGAAPMVCLHTVIRKSKPTINFWGTCFRHFFDKLTSPHEQRSKPSVMPYTDWLIGIPSVDDNHRL